MKQRLMIGVAAAALLSGIGIASAQEKIDRKAPAASAPAVEMNKAAAPDEKAKAGAEQKGKAAAEVKSEKPATNAQATEKTNAGGAAQKSDDKAKNAQSKPDAKSSAGTADIKSGATVKSDSKATSGQGSAASSSSGAKASLTVEQKSKIRDVVLKSSSAPRVSSVNFSLSVGTTIPRTVKFVPVPRVLVDIYPDWRAYDYFIVGDQIVIVDPRTLRIVAVIDV